MFFLHWLFCVCVCSGGAGWDPLSLNCSFQIVWAFLGALNCTTVDSCWQRGVQLN